MNYLIRMNHKNPNELIANRSDIAKMLEFGFETDEQKEMIQNSLKDAVQQDLLWNDIRIKRNTSAGELLFERARQEIKDNPTEVYESLLTIAFNTLDENILDHFGEVLKKEECEPSDFMVEQVLMLRKGCPFEVEVNDSMQDIEGKCMVKIGG